MRREGNREHLWLRDSGCSAERHEKAAGGRHGGTVNHIDHPRSTGARARATAAANARRRASTERRASGRLANIKKVQDAVDGFGRVGNAAGFEEHVGALSHTALNAAPHVEA